MGFDMGETCQADPNLCWPIGQSWIVQEGLVCGTTPARAARLKESGRLKKCAMPGQPEPIQFNVCLRLPMFSPVFLCFSQDIARKVQLRT